MAARGIYFVLTCHILVLGVDGSNVSNIEVCKNAELNRPCKLKCLSRCEGKCEVCLFHKGRFNKVSKICCSSYVTENIENTCRIEMRRHKIGNHTLDVFTLKKLHYDQNGEWFCGIGDKFSTSEKLEPYYLNLKHAKMIASGPSYSFQLPFLADFKFPSALKIYIPCAYPRPTLTVVMQTALYTCLLCQSEEPTQFLKQCEVKGHIGSYNFTCQLSMKLLLKNIQCLNSEHLIVALLHQRGRMSGLKRFHRFLGVKGHLYRYPKEEFTVEYGIHIWIAIPLMLAVLQLFLLYHHFPVMIARIPRDIGADTSQNLKFEEFVQHPRKHTNVLKSSQKVNIIKEFKDGFADGVVSLNNGYTWTYVRTEHTFYIFDEQYIESRQISFDIVKDFAAYATDEIIATDFGNKRIVRISSSGSIIEICSTAPLSPWGICLNNKREIVVGVGGVVAEAGGLIRHRQLVVYSSDGSSVLQEIEYDQSRRGLESGWFNRVRQTVSGDYVVADGASVMYLSTDWKVKWQYDVGSYRSVYGLYCDKYNNIFVANRIESKIMMLSSEGELIKTLHTKSDGISAPYSLSLDNNGLLWIGQKNNILVVST